MNSDTPSKGSSNMPQQMLTDTHHTGASSVVAQYNATPLVERRRPQFDSESKEDPAAKERYREIGRVLQGRDMLFVELIRLLDLQKEYTEYEQTSANFCDDSIDKTLTALCEKSRTPKRSAQRCEADLTKRLDIMYQHMSKLDFSRFPAAKPRELLKLANHETNSVAGTHAKPDYVLYYKGYERRDFRSAHIIIEAKLAQFDDDLPVEVLGQMAYYARCVWETQFTRTFVPVVLLHGTKVDLCLFARSGYSRVPLGQFMMDAKNPDDTDKDTIAASIRKLWFFLVQPSEKFGHFVNVSSIACSLRFNGAKSHATVIRANSYEYEDDSTVTVTGRIDRKMEVSRRAAYLLKVRYQSKDAVLKLSWIPVNRQPEGVLYDLLSGGNHKVDCIPTVFNSGILAPNFLGYRLEFILMEYCGKPLIDDYKGKGKARSEEKHLLTCAENVIQKVTACLLQARRAGVYHRDISAGNITLRGQDVFLIDWGYGKAIPDALDSSQKDKVNKDWGIDISQLTANEDARDGVTGTIYYMSIRVLMGHPNRSILDDIESLLYVVLDAISYIGSGHSGFGKLGLKLVPNRSHAIMKVGCMLDRVDYREYFGITKCSNQVCDLLDLLHAIVFSQNGTFIGNKLMKSEVDIREENKRLLCRLLGEELYTRSTGLEAGSECDPDSYSMSALPQHPSAVGDYQVIEQEITSTALVTTARIVETSVFASRSSVPRPPINKQSQSRSGMSDPQVSASLLRQPSASLLPRLDAMNIHTSNSSAGGSFKRKSESISPDDQDSDSSKTPEGRKAQKLDENTNPGRGSDL